MPLNAVSDYSFKNNSFFASLAPLRELLYIYIFLILNLNPVYLVIKSPTPTPEEISIIPALKGIGTRDVPLYKKGE